MLQVPVVAYNQHCSDVKTIIYIGKTLLALQYWQGRLQSCTNAVLSIRARSFVPLAVASLLAGVRG